MTKVNKWVIVQKIMGLLGLTNEDHHDQLVSLPSIKDRQAIAREQHEARHSPHESAVRASYVALGAWLELQYKTISAYVTAYPWPFEGEPYASSADMISDVLETGVFYYLQTDLEYGSSSSNQPRDNWMLKLSGCKNGHGETMRVNDVFRVVHDIIGHLVTGFGFTGKGEWNATLSHRSTLPSSTHAALYCETFCQTAFFEWGPHLWRADGSCPVYGDSDFVPRNERPFSVQKNYYPTAAIDIINTALRGD